MTKTKPPFPTRLATARKSANMTMEALAQAVGLKHRQSIRQLETKNPPAFLAMVESLARALGVSPAWLVGWSDEGGPKESSPDLQPVMRRFLASPSCPATALRTLLDAHRK